MKKPKRATAPPPPHAWEGSGSETRTTPRDPTQSHKGAPPSLTPPPRSFYSTVTGPSSLWIAQALMQPVRQEGALWWVNCRILGTRDDLVGPSDPIVCSALFPRAAPSRNQQSARPASSAGGGTPPPAPPPPAAPRGKVRAGGHATRWVACGAGCRRGSVHFWWSRGSTTTNRQAGGWLCSSAGGAIADWRADGE